MVAPGRLQLVRQAIVIGSMATLLWQFHPLLPVVILLASLPHLVAQLYYGRFGWRLMHRQAPLYRKQSYFGSVLTGDSHAKEIRLFGLGDHLLGRYVDASLETLRQNWDFRASQRRTSTLLSLLSSAAASGAYLYIVLQAARGRITLGDLALYCAAVSQVQGTLMSLLNSMTAIYETNLHVEDLFQFLDFRPKIVSSPRRLKVTVPLQHGVEFRRVSFSYPDSAAGAAAATSTSSIVAPLGPGMVQMYPPPRLFGGRPARRDGRGRAVEAGSGNGESEYGQAQGPMDGLRPGPVRVLEDVSFAIPAGKTVALVGANGAGKTTLVKLLARLHDPTEGQVLLDGVDLREYDVDDVRRQIAVVFQDYARYQLPARENIGFGQVEHLEDRERAVRAAAQGGAGPVIERLPQGLETTLGRLFSGGVELSGGERQKVALARAFMREAPQLLVLDEPTAALDAQAGYEIYTRFQELTRGKTTVLISHRFSTVRMADLIVVLEGGRVTEQGSHEALLAAGGTYARLYEMQAGRYR